MIDTDRPTQRWDIRGIDRVTGVKRAGIYAAADEREAVTSAGRDGMLVERVRLIVPPPEQPLPAQQPAAGAATTLLGVALLALPLMCCVPWACRGETPPRASSKPASQPPPPARPAVAAPPPRAAPAVARPAPRPEPVARPFVAPVRPEDVPRSPVIPGLVAAELFKEAADAGFRVTFRPGALQDEWQAVLDDGGVEYTIEVFSQGGGVTSVRGAALTSDGYPVVPRGKAFFGYVASSLRYRGSRPEAAGDWAEEAMGSRRETVIGGVRFEAFEAGAAPDVTAATLRIAPDRP